MPPKFSILIPVYNVETYLRECLNSVISQSLKDLEIICINDGSTDGSLAILQEYAKHDKRITLIDKPNSGYGDSMNQALEQANGEYIGIVEPDDYIDQDAFENLYRIAEKFHADVVKSNYYKFNAKKTTTVGEITPELSLRPFKALEHPEVFQFAPAIWSAIYRREFLIENDIKFLPTPGASYQDLSFSFKVWALAKIIVLMPDAFLHYRLDNANSSVNNPGKVNCVVDEYAEIETFLCERGIFQDYGSIMAAAKFRNYHWNLQRLSSKLAKDFYQTFRKEFLSAADEGLLRREDFSDKDWLALQAVLKHPSFAYRTLRTRSGLKKLLRH